MKAKAAVFLKCWLVASSAFAQVGDGCDVPIMYSAHNLNVNTVKRAADDMRYENECQTDRSSGGRSVGVEFKGVNLSYGDSRTSTEQFCSTYKMDTSQKDASYQYSRVVVNEAISAFIACKQLYNQQVRARFSVMPRMLVVDMERLSNSAVFKGISFSPDDALSCTLKNPNGGNSLPADSAAPLPLLDGETTVLTCKRTDKDSSDGTLFEATDVVIDTNRGSATIRLEASRYPPPMTTAQLRSEVMQIASDSVDRDSEMKATLDSLVAYAQAWQVIQESAHKVSAAGKDRLRILSVGCPPGEFIVAIREEGGLASSPIVSGTLVGMTITCVKIPKWPIMTTGP